jgi:hypothetical protein
MHHEWAINAGNASLSRSNAPRKSTSGVAFQHTHQIVSRRCRMVVEEIAAPRNPGGISLHIISTASRLAGCALQHQQ